MRTSWASFLKAASMALSNSVSSTETDTFTLLPSRGSTVVFTGAGAYRPPLTSLTSCAAGVCSRCSGRPTTCSVPEVPADAVAELGQHVLGDEDAVDLVGPVGE